MSNTIIKVSEIVSVRHYNTGWTDYLTVALSSGASYKWSCYHYEESASQREKCDDMRMAFGRIKNAIANKMEFVDFYISDQIMKDKWIKVSDSLPDNDDEVLVYHYKPIYEEWELAIAFYDERLGEFWTTDGWKVHPTYWMPIELPEEE